MSEPRHIATIRDYRELIIALRKRADELGTTLDTIDEVAGLPVRYTAKLIGKFPTKHVGHTSLGPLLYTLGAMLVLVVDEEALAKVKPRLIRRKTNPKPENAGMAVPAGRRRRKTRPFITRRNAKALRCAQILLTDPQRRSEIARTAAKARWKKKGRGIAPAASLGRKRQGRRASREASDGLAAEIMVEP